MSSIISFYSFCLIHSLYLRRLNVQNRLTMDTLAFNFMENIFVVFFLFIYFWLFILAYFFFVLDFVRMLTRLNDWVCMRQRDKWTGHSIRMSVCGWIQHRQMKKKKRKTNEFKTHKAQNKQIDKFIDSFDFSVTTNRTDRLIWIKPLVQ